MPGQQLRECSKVIDLINTNIGVKNVTDAKQYITRMNLWNEYPNISAIITIQGNRGCFQVKGFTCESFAHISKETKHRKNRDYYASCVVRLDEQI